MTIWERRDWRAFAIGVAAAILALVAVDGRYSVHTWAGGALRLDRWTGAVARCSAGCMTAPDRPYVREMPNDWVAPAPSAEGAK